MSRIADPHSLAASLEPVLAEACEGRLSAITWFRTDWQRGGAATGSATFDLSGGERADVVVKLPVVPRELIWMRRLQQSEGPVVPRLFAGNSSLDDYDIAWMVVERFEHGPLGMHWHDDHTRRIADAAARFHAAASVWPVDQPVRDEPWEDLVKKSQESLRINDLPRRPQWRAALKQLRHQLDGILSEWRARNAIQWLHGDLHLANAMSRESMESGAVCLIDLAEVRAGHWIEDAVYLERQFWTRPERLAESRPVKTVAAARRKLQLPVEDEYPRLATIRRALLAATAPCFLESEGDPRHLEACLDRLDQALAERR